MPNRSALIVLIDGMRPDALLQVKGPHMRSLMERGATHLRARTVMPSSTLPCHTSLFYGVEPERHGVTTNTWRPMVRPIASLFDVVSAAKRKTGMFYTWEQLRDVASPGSLSESHMISMYNRSWYEADQEAFAAAARWMSRNPDFGLAFVYYGSADEIGHQHGWMSSEYLRALEDADEALGQLLPHLPTDCLTLLTADHGGHARTHGTDCDEDMTIPLVAHSPQTPAGSAIDREFSIMDIAPTVARWLNLEAPREWMGKPLSW